MNKYLLPALLLLTPSAVFAQSGVDWTGPATGTLGGSSVTLSGLSSSASIKTYNLSLPDYSAAPLAAAQDCVDYRCQENWTASFSPAVNGVNWYGKYIRGFDANPSGSTVEYTFTHPFFILSGFSSATIVGNTLVLPSTGFHHGIIRFSGPIANLSCINSPTSGGFQAMNFGQSDTGSSGDPFCDPADTNSTGLPTLLVGSFGSGVGSGLHLDALQGPPNQFGYLLIGTGISEPGMALSNGHFCLATGAGSAFARYNVVGGVLNSVGQFDSAGVLQNIVGTSNSGSGFDVPTQIPSGLGAISAGSTWNFQLWHREALGEANFSNGLSVDF